MRHRDGQEHRQCRDRQDPGHDTRDQGDERPRSRHVVARDDGRLREAHREGPLADSRVAATIRDLVDVQDQGDEQGDRDRRHERLPCERPAGLDDVGTQQHEWPEADRDGDLAESAIDELERRRRIAEAHDEPDDADDQQRGRPMGRQQDEPDDPGQDVEHGRQRRHLAQADEPVLDDPRTATELCRRDVRIVGALDGIEDVVGDVEPELDEGRPDDGQHGRDEVERAVAGGDEDAQDDRDDRRGEERQAGRPQGQEPERQLRLDRRAALRRQGVEVAARLADGPLRVLEERDLGLVPAPGSAAGHREEIADRGWPGPTRSRGGARRSRSPVAAGCAIRSAR